MACCTAILCSFPFYPANGEQTVYVGGSGKKAIVINLQVLNDLANKKTNNSVVTLFPSTKVKEVHTTSKIYKPSGSIPDKSAGIKLEAPKTTESEVTLKNIQTEAKNDGFNELNKEPVLVPSENLKSTNNSKALNNSHKTNGSAIVVAKKVAPIEKPKLGLSNISIFFTPDGEDISADGNTGIEQMALILQKSKQKRIQIKAYASSSEEDSESYARRLSLTRALKARSKLIKEGIRSTRIDVRALGSNSKSGNRDRVDIILVKR